MSVTRHGEKLFEALLSREEVAAATGWGIFQSAAVTLTTVNLWGGRS